MALKRYRIEVRFQNYHTGPEVWPIEIEAGHIRVAVTKALGQFFSKHDSAARHERKSRRPALREVKVHALYLGKVEEPKTAVEAQA